MAPDGPKAGVVILGNQLVGKLAGQSVHWCLSLVHYGASHLSDQPPPEGLVIFPLGVR